MNAPPSCGQDLINGKWCIEHCPFSTGALHFGMRKGRACMAASPAKKSWLGFLRVVAGFAFIAMRDSTCRRLWRNRKRARSRVPKRFDTAGNKQSRMRPK